MILKKCFVIMPIRRPGTPEHAHFRAIFEQIKPIIEKAGYETWRADDVAKPGAITKDIVAHLAEADLVVADLTDLNPNVFYELGVRHALRGKGTIMIIDEKRTPEIPFDLSAYRVVKFSGDLTGIEPLKTALESFIKDSTDTGLSGRDNPVHDWYPMLPINALEAASQSNAGPLRKQIKELEDRVTQYEQVLGTRLPQKVTDETPLSAVMSALSDAEDGLLPVDVLEVARSAFEERNVRMFLQKVRTVIERDVRLPSSTFLALAKYSTFLDLSDVSRAIFEQALRFYPRDRNLKRSYFFHLAHSGRPADTERARYEIAQTLKLEVTDESVIIHEPERLREDLSGLGLLLDAYHRDGLEKQALRITSKVVEMFPDSTAALRNHARSLEAAGNLADAMKIYRAAVLVPDVDDTSAIWLGNTLHNQGNPVAAAEVYALGCILDPSEAKCFSHLADELSIALVENSLGRSQTRSLPDDIGAQDLLLTAQCAASCPNVDAEVSERVRASFERLELQLERWEAPLSRAERLTHAKRMYEFLRSALTTPGEPYEFLPAGEIPSPRDLRLMEGIDLVR